MLKEKMSFLVQEGYWQEYSFYDDSLKNKFVREIIYPIEYSEVEVKRYFENSVLEIKNIQSKNQERCLFFLALASKESKCRIETYWIDGEIFLIDYNIDGKDDYLIVAVDVSLDKEIILKKIKQESSDFTITHIDHLRDCWIKKDFKN